MFAKSENRWTALLAAGLIALGATIMQAQSRGIVPTQDAASLWTHDNLMAWCVPPFDAMERGPEERAQMLEKVGIRNFAFDWRIKDVVAFDEEIDALQKHGINLSGWALYETDDPGAKVNWKNLTVGDPPGRGGMQVVLKGLSVEAMLETFKRHGVHPQLWLIQPWFSPDFFAEEKLAKPIETMSPQEIREWQKKKMQRDFPKDAQGQRLRVNQEAEKIAALAKLAAPYGVKIELYTRNFWFGMVDNEIAVITRLKELGVNDVGIIYDFVHTRDDVHDDTANFPEIWKKVKPYVVAVNVPPRLLDGTILYPSQGDRAIEMMRTIEESGWRGRIILSAQKGGDAETTLTNAIRGLDWSAAEVKQPGSGGPRPFPRVAE